MKLLTLISALPPTSSRMSRMVSFWRICLTALLVLQVIALPLHAHAEEMQHLAEGNSHHHHTHSADAHQSANDLAFESSAESGEHGCISHCHVPAALLSDALLFKHLPAHFSAVYEHFGFIQNLPEPIDRPQWSAARV